LPAAASSLVAAGGGAAWAKLGVKTGFIAAGATGGGAAASCFASTGRVATGSGLACATFDAAGLAATGAAGMMLDGGKAWASTGATTGLRTTGDGAVAGDGTVVAANCLTGASGVAGGAAGLKARLGKAATDGVDGRVIGVSAGRLAPSEASIDAGEAAPAETAVAGPAGGRTGVAANAGMGAGFMTSGDAVTGAATDLTGVAIGGVGAGLNGAGAALASTTGFAVADRSRCIAGTLDGWVAAASAGMGMGFITSGGAVMGTATGRTGGGVGGVVTDLSGIGAALATTTGFAVADRSRPTAGTLDGWACTAASLIAGGATAEVNIGRGRAGDDGDRSAGSRTRCDPSEASKAAGDPAAGTGTALGTGAFIATNGGAVTGAAIDTADSCTGTGLSGVGFAAGIDFGGAADGSALADGGASAMTGIPSGDESSLYAKTFRATAGLPAAAGAGDACNDSALVATTGSATADARRCWPPDASAGLAVATAADFATIVGVTWAGAGRVAAASAPTGGANTAGGFAAGPPFLARTGRREILIGSRAAASRADADGDAPGAIGSCTLAGARTRLLTTSERSLSACSAPGAATTVGLAASAAGGVTPATVVDPACLASPAVIADGVDDGEAERASAGFATVGKVTTGGAGLAATAGIGLAAGAAASTVGFVGLVAEPGVAGCVSGSSTASLAGATFGALGVAAFVAITDAVDASAEASPGAAGPTTFAWAGACEATIAGARTSAGTTGASFAGAAVDAATVLPVLGKTDTSRVGAMIGEALLPGTADSFASSEAGDASSSGTAAGFAAGDGAGAGAAARRKTVAGAALVAGIADAACSSFFSKYGAGDDRGTGTRTGLARSSEAFASVVFAEGLDGLVGALAVLISGNAADGATAALIGTVLPTALAGATTDVVFVGASAGRLSADRSPALATTGAAGFCAIVDGAEAAVVRATTERGGKATDATTGLAAAGGVTVDLVAKDGWAVAALAEARTGKDEMPDLPAADGDSGSADIAATIDKGVAVDAGLSETEVLADSAGPGFMPAAGVTSVVAAAAVLVAAVGVVLAALLGGFGSVLALAGDASNDGSADGLARPGLATAVAVPCIGAAAGDFTAAVAVPAAFASSAGSGFAAAGLGGVGCAASDVRSGEGGCATAAADGSLAATEIGFDGAASGLTSALACADLAESGATGLAGATRLATAGVSAAGLIDDAGAAALRTGAGLTITFGAFAGGPIGGSGSWLAAVSPASRDGALVAVGGAAFTSARRIAGLAGSGAIAGLTATAAGAGVALAGAVALTSFRTTAGFVGGVLVTVFAPSVGDRAAASAGNDQSITGSTAAGSLVEPV